MRRAVAAALALAAVAASAALAAPQGPVAAALADPSRPAEDRARDADRKPAELIAFAGVKPGQKVAELAAGAGYFTRLLSAAVGPNGRVYPIARQAIPPMEAIAKTHPNVQITIAQPGTIPVPEPVDLVWTTLNYHDFKNVKVGTGDAAAVINAAAFKALKPGGVYLIVDHEAGKGVGTSATSTLHRIEGAAVRREVEAAGFRFEAESPLLRHAADEHKLGVTDPAIRGKTDQFVYRFRKPRR